VSLSPAFLDELRARVPLQPIVARRVKLTRAGREWKGCCPFHNEKSPSFYVNDDKGFYHCFGCGAHGDVIRFLTEQEGLPFMEAVKQLAAQAGMEVPAASPQAKERAEAGDALSKLAGEAAAWFQQQLASDGGAAARDYLARRGLNAATIKAFGLGWAPDNRTALRSHFAKVDSAQLLEAGLIGRTDAGEIYDRFRGRVMFPIRDRRGRVVGFGGRAMGDAQPKYLNSADGPLFDKGRLLYNLDRAGPVGRKAGRIIVVEGYMDVIGLAQAGIAEAVAPLGTAMTEAQLELAWRVADEPILCFDGDSAGKRAALRAATRALPLLQPGKSLRIATLPAGEDPDDLCRRGGGAAFEAVLAEAVPLIDLLWTSETAGLEQATPERKAAARARLRAHIGTIADPGIRQLYGAECDRRFDAAYLARPPRAPWQPASRGQRGQRGGPFIAPIILPSDDLKRQVAAGGDRQAQVLLAGLLRHPELADQHEEALAALPLADPGHAALRDVLLDRVAAGDLESAGLDDHLASAGLAALAAGIRRAAGEGYSFTRDGADADQARQDFAAMLEHVLARHRIGQALAEATARFAETLAEGDFAIQQALLAEQQAVDAAMMALAQLREDG
jgi:DNA primase